MRKLLLALALVVGLAVPSTVSAYHLPASYQAVYCYPSGSYWQVQLAAYPDYYAAYGSYYASLYGSATIYCN